MKENVLDVLMYLFQNYMDGEFESEPDRESLHVELLEAGFPPVEVNKAFDWLDDLAARSELPETGPQTARSIRLYTEEEMHKLDVECRGFLLFLEQAGIVTPAVRELIVERTMALESSEIDIERLKWLIMMVLFNQPGQEGAYEWIEDMVFDGSSASLH
jgi:Smg protein